MSKILRIEKRHPKTALENLNRLTGLEFEHWPESILECGEQVVAGNLQDCPGGVADSVARAGQGGAG